MIEINGINLEQLQLQLRITEHQRNLVSNELARLSAENQLQQAEIEKLKSAILELNLELTELAKFGG